MLLLQEKFRLQVILADDIMTNERMIKIVCFCVWVFRQVFVRHYTAPVKDLVH